MPGSKLNLRWEALEFQVHQRNWLWYVGYLVVGGVLVGYAIYTRSILTVATFVVISIVAFVFAHQNPKTVTHELSQTGIRVGNSFYPYRNIRKFWIVYTRENKTLNLETTAYLNSQVSLQLGTEDPLPIREYLKAYISEDLDQEETLIDILARKIRF